MAPMYYRNANAALLVYDISNHQSFEEVKFWVLELQKNVQESMFLLLVGNKTDLENKRAVTAEEAVVYAQSIGAKFLETSILLDKGIEKVFYTIALGLINLSMESKFCTMKRFESKESMYSDSSSNDLTHLGFQSYDGVHMAIDMSSQSVVETNGVGRIENGPWRRDAVAYGYPQRSGWCC